LRDKHSIKILCDIASVSVSGYCKYFKDKGRRKEKDKNDYLLIKEVFDGKKSKIGARTIKMNLSTAMNLKKIRRIMKKYGLACNVRRINKARVSLKKNKENMFVKNHLQSGPDPKFLTPNLYIINGLNIYKSYEKT